MSLVRFWIFLYFFNEIKFSFILICLVALMVFLFEKKIEISYYAIYVWYSSHRIGVFRNKQDSFRTAKIVFHLEGVIDIMTSYAAQFCFQKI
jgi:hypothetical protein